MLLTVLETVLGLLHPVTPFVTEEIWSVLPGERRPLMVSVFPVVEESWKDEEAEQQMALLMGVITGIRNIRSEAEVHPSSKIEAFVNCRDAAQRELLESFGPAMSDMCRLSGFTVQGEG